MNIFWKSCVAMMLLFVVSLLIAATTVDGRSIIRMEYDTTGERHWFATSTGNGDCTSWNNACTFRTAVGKCTSAVFDVIHVGAGDHDLDNGSDATGTTISVDHVSVRGQEMLSVGHARLINSAASVTNVLIGTGDGLDLQYVEFDQSSETDTDATLLNIQGDNCSISNSNFLQSAGASGTGGHWGRSPE